ncbi:MAG: hypothetical protein KIS66_12665 [Fimbriimonadaceae bacterium]|nr:hypothetical protein [Fimbriimonadaceae bacterium]
MLVPFLSCVMGLAGQAQLPNRHLGAPPGPKTELVRVNGVAITGEDLAAYLWEWRGADVLQEVVAYRIAADEAAKQGVTVSDAEVDKAVDRRLQTMREALSPGKTLEDALQEQGFSRSRLFVRQKSEALLDRICLKTLDPKTWIRVSAMIFPPQGPGEAGLGIAESIAHKAIERLRQGVSWTTVYTDARDPRPRLGLEDWWPTAFFPDEARGLLLTAGVGAVVGPVRTGRGVEVFRVEGLGETAKGDERTLLERAHLTRNRDALIERLRSEYKVERLWRPKVRG